MNTLTIVLSDEMLARLEAISGEAPDAQARVVEEALKTFLDRRATPEKQETPRSLNIQPFPDGKSFYDMTKDICGMFEGPGDLSTNPKYMEGFGEE